MLIRYCKITRANSTQRYLPSTFEQSGKQSDVSFVYYPLISVCPSFRLPACFSLSLCEGDEYQDIQKDSNEQQKKSLR